MVPAVLSIVQRIYFLKRKLLETIHFFFVQQWRYQLLSLIACVEWQMLTKLNFWTSWSVNSWTPDLKIIADWGNAVLLFKGHMQDTKGWHLRIYIMYYSIIPVVVRCDFMVYWPSPSFYPSLFSGLALHFLLKIWSKTIESKSIGVSLWEFFHCLQWVSF